MPRRIVILAVLGLAVLAAGAWFGYGWIAGPRVTLAEARHGPAVEAVYATARVEPVHWGKVGPLDTGRLAAIFKYEGDAVAEGDALARLDDREEQARVNELEARRRFLEVERDRYAALAQRGIAPSQTAERTLSELNQVVAAIVQVQQRLDQHVLRAPVAGIVLSRNYELGEVVRPGDTVFTVGRPAPLWAVADVDEEDIPRVHAGQEALIRADAFPGQVLRGTVSEIRPLGDPVQRSYRVRVGLPADTPLMIGMTVEVNIVVRRQDDALLVPLGAVTGGAVYVVEGGTAHRRAVRTGTVGDEAVEILAGLTAGERVVVNPPAGLRDGGAVRAEQPAPGPAPAVAAEGSKGG